MPLLLLPPLESEGAFTLRGGPSSARVPGPVRLRNGAVPIRPRSISSTALVPGPKAPANPVLQQPIRPRGIRNRSRVSGPYFPPVPVPAGLPVKRVAVAVPGYDDSTAITVRPRFNDLGEGTFTCVPPGPAFSELVSFTVSGRQVMRGKVTSRKHVLRAQNNEAGQLVDVTATGTLVELEYARVLPDFGAQDLSRLGPPTQDERRFDWSMNGIGTDDPDGITPPAWVPSVGANNQYGTDEERFPLPDQWPDPDAKWMWVSDPLAEAQPVGWCFFREAFAAAGRIQIWCVPYDFAQIDLDGVPVLTATAGKASWVEWEVRDDFHRLTISAHNGGGKAGLLVAVMPVGGGSFGDPLLHSTGGWKALAYPLRTYRLNPGQIMRRLFREARARNIDALSSWSLDFDETTDSAGRPWGAPELTSVRVGSTYLDVVRQLGASQVDWCEGPQGRTLRMFKKDLGTGTSRGAPYEDGGNIVSMVRTETLG